ncbi:MAG: NADH-quinone oxidoreductase subunit N [Proteobacteria bacterium]|nr:NADH-quinone oxidoreductase subunit N [Pseudomonadota bacterium]
MLTDLSLFTPWMVLALGILLTLLGSVIRVESRRPAQFLAVATLIATLLSALNGIGSPPVSVFNGTLEISALTRSVLALLSVLGVIFAVGTGPYLDRERLHLSDYYHLLLILILGASILVCSKDLVVSFIALEVMSLPAYTLTGFRRNDPRSNEAAIKYFVLGGAIGAVFLLGTSFVFGATGTTNISMIYDWSRHMNQVDPLFATGHALILISFLFKAAAAPFHFWKPDVYEGAPVPVTGIMATIVTSAAFVFLVRMVHLVDLSREGWMSYGDFLRTGIRVGAVASLVIGSAVMVTQKNLKRMMAYSAIAHTGYLMMGLLGTMGSAEAMLPVLVYLGGYVIMTSGVFVLLSLSETAADSGVELIDLTGLMKKAPFQTLLWTVFLFSMAGMPFTVGFFTKYSVFVSSMAQGETVLAVLAALCAVASAYAYLRPVALMVMREPDPGAATWGSAFSSQTVAVCAAVAVVALGILPNPMLQYLKGILLIH